MKATITKDGHLKVSAENELESFALRKWAEDPVSISNCGCKKFEAKIIIETGLEE